VVACFVVLETIWRVVVIPMVVVVSSAFCFVVEGTKAESAAGKLKLTGPDKLLCTR